MNAVISALMTAFEQLTDRVVVMLLLKTVAVTLLIMVMVGTGLYFAFAWMLDAGGLEASGWVSAGWVEAAAVLLAALASWFLFRVVALAVLQFFADEVVIAVEARHYPQAAAQARKLPFSRDLSNSVRGIGRALLFNALALPVAVVLLFTAIGPAIVFLLVNAVLLGRELTEMTWARHCGEPPEANPVPGMQRFLLGGVIAAIMLVPFANFIAPILGAAAGAHLAHGAMGTSIQNDPITKGEAARDA